ncbi:hypothetical protein [Hymenobacter sp. IS2118]|uniref:hypothetical protein n=1 Tax=Hymenobacter sp. IS2118 TaxID=1505605 RepID=UPI0012690243|nr:hypothetical protein [Hymenobacter sp. IS2118]
MESYLEIEVPKHWAQQLLRRIAVAQEAKQAMFEDEGNVYQVFIYFEHKQVEIWDTIMHYDKSQVPCRMALEDFVIALNTRL